MVSGAEAVAEQVSAPPVPPETISAHPFLSAFLPSSDRIYLRGSGTRTRQGRTPSHSPARR